MDWRAKVELYEQIRREYEFGIGTIAGVAKKLGVHRRMVREAISSALPKPRKKTERPRWKLKAAVKFIDAILEGDRKAPRKQRHTAHRIWVRMQHELAECEIAERTVREYVHDRKIALGICSARDLRSAEVTPGAWKRRLTGTRPMRIFACERIKLQVFAMRSMASGAACHCAYQHATQQAFLEAHELAFAYFGGVFRKLRYDNLTSAVKKVLRGSRREENRSVPWSSVRIGASKRSFVRQPSPTLEGRDRRGSRIFSAQPLGAGAESGGRRRSEPAAVGGLPTGRTPFDRGDVSRRWELAW